MRPLFPPLGDKDALPRRVLCVAPHADDEVFGCGGMLAFHAARGDAVRVLVLTDGAAGDPASASEDLRSVREAESRRAGEELGVSDHRFLGLPDGGLGARHDLVARLAAEVEEFGPELVYAPATSEMHPDHRAASRATFAALARTPDVRAHLYGVNRQVDASVVYDVTALWEAKERAIRRFESQARYHDLVGKNEAFVKSYTVNVDDPAIVHAEAFVDLPGGALQSYEAAVRAVQRSVLGHGAVERPELPRATAVVSTWNKVDVVRANLDSLRAQTLPFESIVVVDNASTDGTAETIASEYPEVRLIVMPNASYGACETFNIGFASVTTPLLAILDDDIELPPHWLERATERLAREPETTAVLSTKVVEPGMPESYSRSPRVNRERYMSTFRGCGSLARTDVLRRAGWYDERLFIYGNERDLTCRILNLGYRVLQYPEVETHHKTPFGIQMGRRSLYYHARNAWLSMLKYAPASELARMPWLVLTRVLLRRSEGESSGEVADATGTIGIGRSLRATPGAPWILARAALSVLYNVPYCLRRRSPVRAPDFELPIR